VGLLGGGARAAPPPDPPSLTGLAPQLPLGAAPAMSVAAAKNRLSGESRR
jgi:hypothetical protein